MDGGLLEQEQLPDVTAEDPGEGTEILPWGHGKQIVRPGPSEPDAVYTEEEAWRLMERVDRLPLLHWPHPLF